MVYEKVAAEAGEAGGGRWRREIGRIKPGILNYKYNNYKKI